MTVIHAKTALLPDGWARDVRVTVSGGRIVQVETGVPGSSIAQSVDCLLPAMVNLHSHAFQRAMAGMTEARGVGQDSFWTWRALMYRFLDRLTPADVEAIAAQVMVETFRNGPYTWFDGATALLALLLAGRVLDRAARKKARQAVAELLALQDGMVGTKPLSSHAQSGIKRAGRRAPADAEAAFGRWPHVYQADAIGSAPIWKLRHG